MDLTVFWEAQGRYIGSGQGGHISWLALYPPSLGCLGLGGLGSPTPQGSILTDIEARVTQQGRQYLARTLVDGTAFRITDMALGAGGYDVAEPTQALAVDPTVTELSNELFRKPIDQIEIPTAINSRSFVARFNAGSFAGGVGEMGLFATILSSPIPAEVGTTFLFALAHMGLSTKTLHTVVSYRIIVTI